MQFLKADRQEKICTGRYSKWFWNQNGDYLLNLYESKNLEKHKSYLLYKVYWPELYFLLKVQITTIKVACHRGDGKDLGKEYHLW